MCENFDDLLVDFQDNILNPLKKFFNDEVATACNYISRLVLIQMQWKQLLSPGAINSAHFFLRSDIFLTESEMHESFHCFYLVLRLIPDLCFKAEKSIDLVRQCLDTDNSKAYKRERNFLLHVWLPKQRQEERRRRDEEKLVNIDEDIKLTESKHAHFKKEIIRLREAISRKNQNLRILNAQSGNLKQELQKCLGYLLKWGTS